MPRAEAHPRCNVSSINKMHLQNHAEVVVQDPYLSVNYVHAPVICDMLALRRQFLKNVVRKSYVIFGALVLGGFS